MCKTTTETPPGETRWSCRSMAEAAGIGPAAMQRIWRGPGPEPHLTTTFKVSNDPHRDGQLIGAVGLYLDPPDEAVVCMDEKSQIQALDPTQPSLPMTKLRAVTTTRDDQRNGTTTSTRVNATDRRTRLSADLGEPDSGR